MQNVGGFTVNEWKNPQAYTDKLVIQLNNKGEHKDLEDFQDVLKAFPDKSDSDCLDFEFKSAQNGNLQLFLNRDVTSEIATAS